MMAKTIEKQFTEGGFKAVVLAAGAIFITAAAEAYRLGDVQTALVLGVGGAVAFGIHEALSQYQFAFADDFHEFVAETLPGVERPSDGEE